LPELQGGKTGPTTDATLYKDWIAAAVGVVDDWTSGKLDNQDVSKVSARLQELGIGGSDVLDWNRQYEEESSIEWHELYDLYEASFLDLCLVEGAMALMALDKQAGKEVFVDKRKKYIERARHNSQNSFVPNPYNHP